MVKNMKHIKLFENWAYEEDILPDWLNPNWKPPKTETGHTKGSNIYTYKTYIQKATYLNLIKELGKDKRVNFKSFSDYSFWKKGKYVQIYVNQDNCIYRLEDGYGIPKTDWIHLDSTDVKSLKGIEYFILEGLIIQNNKIENFKYIPKIIKNRTEIYENKMLLSYYGHPGSSLQEINNNYNSPMNDSNGNLCSDNYNIYIANKVIDLKSSILRDISLNAEIFTLFDNKEYLKQTKDARLFKINPWHNIYNDPNDVENYEFLFIPFYMESENFRNKVKENIPEFDGGALYKENIW